LFSNDFSKFIDSINEISVWDDACLSRGAIAAFVHGRADLAVVEALSAVDRARLIRDVVVVDPFVGVVRLATVASKVFVFAGDDHLGRQVDVGPGAVSSYFNSIRQSRGSCVSPAGTTIERHVLVAHLSDQIGTIGIVPDPLVRQVDINQRSFDDGSTFVRVVSVARVLRLHIFLSQNHLAGNKARSYEVLHILN